jgi:hypothetical protein
MRALIMTRRKTTAATTQLTIVVIFERRKDVEFGNKTKLLNYKNKQTNMKFFITSFINRLIKTLNMLLFINTSQ